MSFKIENSSTGGRENKNKNSNLKPKQMEEVINFAKVCRDKAVVTFRALGDNVSTENRDKLYSVCMTIFERLSALFCMLKAKIGMSDDVNIVDYLKRNNVYSMINESCGKYIKFVPFLLECLFLVQHGFLMLRLFLLASFVIPGLALYDELSEQSTSERFIPICKEQIKKSATATIIFGGMLVLFFYYRLGLFGIICTLSAINRVMKNCLN